MPFLKSHKCHINFNKSVVMMVKSELACVDKFCRSLMARVEVVRRCTIPGRSRVTVCCRVNCRKISDLGMLEGALGGVQLANSLHRLDERSRFLVQCVNSFTEPVELLAGLWKSSTSCRRRMQGLPWRQQRKPVKYPLQTAGDRYLNTWWICIGMPVLAVRVAGSAG